MFRLRTLQDFSYNDAGDERGSGIREKATLIVELLQDEKRLDEEREKSRKAAHRFTGLSNEDPYSRNIS